METTKKNGAIKTETFDSNATLHVESNLFQCNFQILIPADNAWKKAPTVAEMYEMIKSSITSEAHIKPEDIQIVKAMFRKV